MNQREASKQNWNLFTDGHPTIQEINSGSLQRIADATELMASNYTRLQNELQWMKESKERQRLEATRLFNQVRTLKGVITKLKKKLNPPVNNG